ncbi:MAG: helix-turn-helix transcriptional regulator [Rickettsiaceae bacterium]|nr:helix-turn-helix transcriptional regulator [Rickettsiaceae bacterium]MDP4832533.1 helix-turn-helix transcriptional regulator [Rickettsiaceae bacterium]MDP5020225.1 helix-turn-helix transcriptional regulator [Rickettsiaceae bacterium]MDP5083506.1 helix-turn-helix transcriptional regulator [Rickettsiaceae bacterium]
MSENTETRGRADNVDKLVSRRLKTRRMMLGLSQHDLGKAVDVSIQQIQKYEKLQTAFLVENYLLFQGS